MINFEHRVVKMKKGITRISVEDMKDLVNELRCIILYHCDYVIQEAIELANKASISEQPKEAKEKFGTYKERYNYFVNDFNKFLRLLEEKLKIAVGGPLKSIGKEVLLFGSEKTAPTPMS